MFSKGIVLIFLTLFLSSSIAHAVPYENRAANPCDDNPGNTPAVSSSSPSPSGKVTGISSASKGKGSHNTANGSNKGANPKGNGKSDTSANGNNSVNPQGKGKNDTTTNANGNKNANPKGSALSKGAQTNGNNTTGNNNNDPNTSLCLDTSVVAKGSSSNGLNNATAGTSASLTSTNNFINFCTGKTITNGQQVKGGSCNPIPMGQIASTTNIPSCKYVFPKNLDTLKANTAFTMKVTLKNLQAGVFTNPESNYYAAPQQLNQQGNIIGHTHLVVEKLDSLTSTTPTDPTKFTFFKGIDNATDAEGNVSTDVTAGLPAGVYRFGTITTAANHQPGLVAVAQHGTLEDAVYATVTADGNPTNTGNNGNNTGTNGNNTGNNNGTTTGDTSGNGGKGGQKTGNGTAGAANATATNKNNNKSAGTGSKSANKKGTGKNHRRAFSLEYRRDRF